MTLFCLQLHAIHHIYLLLLCHLLHVHNLYTHSLICNVQSNTLRDLNTTLLMPMFGYKDPVELYQDVSPHNRLEHITVPVLALNAADDPFCPETGNTITRVVTNK